MLRPTRSSAAYRYPLRRTGFWQHYLLDYDAYDTVGSTQKSTLSGAFLHVRFGSLAELCEHGLADLIHVADDAVGAVVEDRRLGIRVHGDDHVRVREARDVVDRARHSSSFGLTTAPDCPMTSLNGSTPRSNTGRVQASLPPRRSARRR